MHGRVLSGCWPEVGLSRLRYDPSCSRSQGGGYGDRNSGGSYRDSYDSYGKSYSEGLRWELRKHSVNNTQTLSLCLLVRNKTAISGLGANSHFYHKTKAKPD